MSDENIELRHLRSFVAVATRLNFSLAAADLHLAQQSLSAQIQQLEQRVGARLLDRTTRHVELTEPGRLMLGLSISVLEEVRTGLERVRRAAVGDIGQLSLSFTPTISHETLPALLDQVERNAPGLDLRVSEMWQADSVEAVRTGRLDAGLARHPELPPELDSINIRDEPLGVVVARTHPLAGRTALDPSELTDSTLFIWPRDFSPGFFDQVVGFYRANGFDGHITEMRLLSRGSFLSDRTAHQAIKAGAAFSVSFEHEHDAMPEDLVWRPAHPGPLIGVHLYWRRPATPAVHRLADLALQLSKARSWL